MHLCAAVARLPLSVARDLGHGMSGIWESLINESAQSRRRERTRLSHSSVALLGPGPAPRVSPQVGRGRMGFPARSPVSPPSGGQACSRREGAPQSLEATTRVPWRLRVSSRAAAAPWASWSGSWPFSLGSVRPWWAGRGRRAGQLCPHPLHLPRGVAARTPEHAVGSCLLQEPRELPGPLSPI